MQATLKQEIYSIVLERGTASVREVCDALGNSRKYTTVMTVMNRMVDSAELFRERTGLFYTYRINEFSRRRLPSFLSQLKQKLFRGKTSVMIACLLESDDSLSDAELTELEKMIEARRQR